MELRTVLIVEDDADIRMLAELALRDVGGLDVRAVEDGRAVFAALEQARVDLILMDVMMPGMSGPDTLDQLKADGATREIPVVLMTAKSEHEQLEQYRAQGALDVIVKPFEPMTLAERLRGIYADAVEAGKR